MPSSSRLVLSCLLLGACASPSIEQRTDHWHGVTLPGKAATHYEQDTKEGQPAIRATADRSASLWRRRLPLPPDAIGGVEFSWWVQALVADADIGDAEREDAAARVLFAFDGDHGRLSQRNQLLFDLAQAITGERPPYATLMYVYGNSHPTNAIVTNPRSDRVRKIVIDSGPGHLQRWRVHRRDLAGDFRAAFGEAPGALLSVAIMTDTDNTRAQARTWYGPVQLR